jgi:hypothetical protein
MEFVAKERNIQAQDDWYKVTARDIRNHGGRGLLDRYGDVIKILRIVYPTYLVLLLNNLTAKTSMAWT